MFKNWLLPFCVLSVTALKAQQQSDTLQNKQVLQDVVVSGTKAKKNQPVTFTNLSKKEIEQQNFGQDLPFLLNLTPSTVVNSDAGAGIGYTGIRIRGTDPSRTNVTINGIPVNDAESHGTFWVNIPDFASSTQGIQVQRGVGTSANGAAAFGASINIQTDLMQPTAYGEVSSSFGSFNTWKHTIKAGTGLLDNKWAVDARLSQITSDGFIDRGASDLKSFFVSGAHYGKKSIFKMNVFSGKEITYQAWNGIPESRLKGDAAAMNDFALNNGLSDAATQHLLNSGNRTYNSFTYPNQTDNYQQDHYQLFYTYQAGKYSLFHIGAHYTYGRGYYEEYRSNETFSTYKLADSLTLFDRFLKDSLGRDSATFTTIKRGDFIRRRWLDNDFYGTVFSFVYEKNKLGLTAGGGINRYEGRHYGELIWGQYTQGSAINDRFYEGQSTKTDGNIYIKADYELMAKLHVFADLQQRVITYKLKGEDLNNGVYLPYQFNLEYYFFNPKAGLTYEINKKSNLYIYVGVAGKEPVRGDIIQAGVNSVPLSERLINYEFGYRGEWKKTALMVNVYYMDYRDQLIATGQINDVGAYNRINVPLSYRTGVEISGGVQLYKTLKWQATLTYSDNRIKSFTSYIDDYDKGGQATEKLSNKKIAFSPDIIASSNITWLPIKNVQFDLISKFVGAQYLDNTESKTRMLDAFFVSDMRLGYAFKIKGLFKQVNAGLLINNILNTKYEPNGYTYGWIYGGQRIDNNFYYPQAGTNFLAQLKLAF